VAHEGEALHFRKHTWHYGYNFTDQETIVAEAFAPVPPESEFNMDGLNRAAPPLKRVVGGRYDLLDNWPWNAERARDAETMKSLPASAWLNLIQGEANPIRVSLFVATDKLTMGRFDLLPGVIADPEAHPGDEVALVVEGTVHIRAAGDDNIYELSERDAFFTPAGVEHQYYNLTGKRSAVVFGVAPRFR
jgi:quercetin dioxygenase-like cupin family protein